MGQNDNLNDIQEARDKEAFLNSDDKMVCAIRQLEIYVPKDKNWEIRNPNISTIVKSLRNAQDAVLNNKTFDGKQIGELLADDIAAHAQYDALGTISMRWEVKTLTGITDKKAVSTLLENLANGTDEQKKISREELARMIEDSMQKHMKDSPILPPAAPVIRIGPMLRTQGQ